MPIEAYRGSVHATNELFRICLRMWHSERIPPELARGTFIMLHQKGPRDDMANYRAICLLCHSYKLLSAVVARRLMAVLEDRLPDTQAGFRQARRCRDNVCALRWFINMVLREGRQAIVTFIDYSAAFDTESQLFLDSALSGNRHQLEKFGALFRPYSPRKPIYIESDNDGSTPLSFWDMVA